MRLDHVQDGDEVAFGVGGALMAFDELATMAGEGGQAAALTSGQLSVELAAVAHLIPLGMRAW